MSFDKTNQQKPIKQPSKAAGWPPDVREVWNKWSLRVSTLNEGIKYMSRSLRMRSKANKIAPDPGDKDRSVMIGGGTLCSS